MMSNDLKPSESYPACRAAGTHTASHGSLGQGDGVQASCVLGQSGTPLPPQPGVSGSRHLAVTGIVWGPRARVYLLFKSTAPHSFVHSFNTHLPNDYDARYGACRSGRRRLRWGVCLREPGNLARPASQAPERLRGSDHPEQGLHVRLALLAGTRGRLRTEFEDPSPAST